MKSIPTLWRISRNCLNHQWSFTGSKSSGPWPRVTWQKVSPQYGAIFMLTRANTSFTSWGASQDRCCCSVAQSCLTLWPHGLQYTSFPVLQHHPGLLRLTSIESVMPSNYLILHHPLLLLPSIFPSIMVSSKELALPIRWPKYWSFSISPSKWIFRVDFL